MKKYVVVLLSLCLFATAQAQTNIDLRALVQFNDEANDVWGYADSSGKEYAFIGLRSSTEIVDVTDPDNPVKLHSIPGPHSTWRDIKTWDHYAYVTNETGDGLLIIDMATVSGTLAYKYENFGAAMATAHNIYIDENGFAYMLGYNDSIRSIPTDQRGAYIIDLRSDPWNPIYAGKYSANYVHDAFVRGDTLWASQIYAGTLGVVDVSVKGNPVVLAQQETPSRFTHNNWLSDDGTFHVTTDEVSGGYLGFYDVSDLENITETDRYQSSPGSGVIPHNAYFLGDYVVVSYYKDGVRILDATKHNNVVEVGSYDTSPFIASDGFNGCWGVYPFLPSGTILASDIEEGLFILTPSYTRACYVEGKATQTANGANLGNVKVEVMGTDNFAITDFNGNYATGIGAAGSYDIRFTRAGCSTKIFTDVALTAGSTTTLNAALECNITGIADADLPQPYLTAKPSVFNGQTSVSFFTGESGLAQSTIALYDLNGRLLGNWEVETPYGEIVVGDNLPAGMYMVTLNNPNFAHTIKLLKNQ